MITECGAVKITAI